MSELEAIFILCSFLLLIIGLIKNFKSTNIFIKLATIFFIIGEWSFILDFLKGLLAGILK